MNITQTELSSLSIVDQAATYKYWMDRFVSSSERLSKGEEVLVVFPHMETNDLSFDAPLNIKCTVASFRPKSNIDVSVLTGHALKRVVEKVKKDLSHVHTKVAAMCFKAPASQADDAASFIKDLKDNSIDQFFQLFNQSTSASFQLSAQEKSA